VQRKWSNRQAILLVCIVAIANATQPAFGQASEDRNTALIVAENAHNVSLPGSGTIDGKGRAFAGKVLPRFDPYFDAAATRQEPRLSHAWSRPAKERFLVQPYRYWFCTGMAWRFVTSTP